MKLSAVLVLQSAFLLGVHAQLFRPWTNRDCQRVRIFAHGGHHFLGGGGVSRSGNREQQTGSSSFRPHLPPLIAFRIRK